jgi:hypothetical protein
VSFSDLYLRWQFDRVSGILWIGNRDALIAYKPPKGTSCKQLFFDGFRIIVSYCGECVIGPICRRMSVRRPATVERGTGCS